LGRIGCLLLAAGFFVFIFSGAWIYVLIAGGCLIQSWIEGRCILF
jgi:hypothetical protein